jgi:uncharacterized protein (TIGR02594 family)
MNKMFEIALTQYGIREFPGANHNPEVLKYFSECGFPQVRDDETSWCSAFMCWCAIKAGYPIPTNNPLLARSWLNWGEPVFEPQIGDIAIYWREARTSWKGHVHMYVRNNGSLIWGLGGNQSNQVCIASTGGTQLLGFRRWLM